MPPAAGADQVPRAELLKLIKVLKKRIQARDGEIATLKSTLQGVGDATENPNGATVSQIDEHSNEEMGVLQGELKTVTEKNVKQEKIIAELKNDIETLERKYGEMKNNMEQEIKDVQDICSKKVSQLVETNEKFQIQFETLVQERKRFENDYLETQDTLEKLKSEYTQSEYTISELQKVLESNKTESEANDNSEVVRLQQELEASRAKQQELEVQLNDNNEVIRLQQELEASRAKQQELEVQLNDNNEVIRLQQELEASRVKQQELEVQLNDNSDVDKLQNELEATKLQEFETTYQSVEGRSPKQLPVTLVPGVAEVDYKVANALSLSIAKEQVAIDAWIKTKCELVEFQKGANLAAKLRSLLEETRQTLSESRQNEKKWKRKAVETAKRFKVLHAKYEGISAEKDEEVSGDQTAISLGIALKLWALKKLNKDTTVERDELLLRCQKLAEEVGSLAANVEQNELTNSSAEARIETMKSELQLTKAKLEQVEGELISTQNIMKELKTTSANCDNELQTAQSQVKKLKVLLGRNRKQLESHEAKLAEFESSDPPSGFNHEAIRCRIEIGGSIWCYIKLEDSESPVKWITDATALRWLAQCDPSDHAVSLLPTTWNAQMEQESQLLQQKCTGLQHQLDSLAEKHLSQLSTYRKRAQIALKQAKSTLQNEQQQKVENQAARILELESNITELEERCGKLDRDVRDQEVSKQELQDSIRMLERQAAEYSSQLGEVSHESQKALENSRGEFSKQLAQMTKQLNAKEDKLVLLESEIEKSAASNDLKDSELMELRRKIDQLEEERDGLRSEVSELDNQLMEYENKLKQHQKQKSSHISSAKLEIDSEALLETGQDSSEKEPLQNTSKQDVATINKKRSVDESMLSSKENSADQAILGREGLNPPSYFVQHFEENRARHREEMVKLQGELDSMQAELRDALTEKSLFAEQTVVLKEQYRELQLSIDRQEKIAPGSNQGMDNFTYLKNAVHRYMLASNISEQKAMVPAISTILKFTPHERDQIVHALDGTSGVKSSVVSWARSIIN